ncbi:MAG: hypothetical protein SVY53_08655 [Chloroflexota bacterium]|nr:hypothetical protein [Chloroflexota bacterium]
MRRTGGFKGLAEFEAFAKTLEEQDFHVESKSFGLLKLFNVRADNLCVELQLREANVPDEEDSLTPRDYQLLELIKQKYRTEGRPKMQFSC